MPDRSIHQVSTVELYNTSTSLPAWNAAEGPTDVRVPARKTTTASGLPVLALYKGGTKTFTVYFLITREERGFIFDHYYYEGDMVQVTDDPFSLSEGERKEVETYLSTIHREEK